MITKQKVVSDVIILGLKAVWFSNICNQSPKCVNLLFHLQRFLDPATPPFKTAAAVASSSAASSSSSPSASQSDGMVGASEVTSAPRPLIEARPLMAVEIPCIGTSKSLSTSSSGSNQQTPTHPPPLMPEALTTTTTTAAATPLTAAAVKPTTPSVSAPVADTKIAQDATTAAATTHSTTMIPVAADEGLPGTIQETLLSALESAGNRQPEISGEGSH